MPPEELVERRVVRYLWSYGEGSTNNLLRGCWQVPGGSTAQQRGRQAPTVVAGMEQIQWRTLMCSKRSHNKLGQIQQWIPMNTTAVKADITRVLLLLQASAMLYSYHGYYTL